MLECANSLKFIVYDFFHLMMQERELLNRCELFTIHLDSKTGNNAGHEAE